VLVGEETFQKMAFLVAGTAAGEGVCAAANGRVQRRVKKKTPGRFEICRIYSYWQIPKRPGV
jgi:hypothetical protein